MEKLPKFAIYLAIGIGVTIFALFLYTILPHIIENSSRDWDRALGNNMSDEELEVMIYAEPSYVIFKEKYPDATENFNNGHRGNASLEMTAMNYTNFNEVRLNIHYNNYDDQVQSNASCQINIPGNERELHRNAQDEQMPEFLEKMDCLNRQLPYEGFPQKYDEPVIILD